MKAEAIAKKIKLVCLDVDGVLTDGSIIISGQGELFKQFYVRDGLGVYILSYIPRLQSIMRSPVQAA